MDWNIVGYALIAGIAGFFLYRTLKYNKQNFTGENFTKTARTLGLLALLLIVVIWFCALLLR